MVYTPKPTVIGVAHSFLDEDYPKVIDYVKNNICEGHSVSLELTPSLEELVRWNLASDSTGDFWKSIVSEVLKKPGCSIQGVDDKILGDRTEYLLSHLLAQLNYGAIGYLTHIISRDFIPFWKEFLELNILRSIHMHEKAVENKSDFLILGAGHAYDIGKLGRSSNIVYLTNIPLTLKIISAINCRRFKKGKITKEKYLRQQ